jgi:multicomponent Na+:H+ antiporter subunit F
LISGYGHYALPPGLTAEGHMMEAVTQFALVTLGLALLIAVVRLVKGPTLPDRIVAMDLIGVLVVSLIVVLAASTNVRATLDAAIVIALIGFVGTVAYATYVERGHPE